MDYRTDFTLLDLCTQYEAVGDYIHRNGWNSVDVLEWISGYGLVEWNETYHEFIHHPHVSNERSAFYFAEEQKLYIFRIRSLLTNGQHRFQYADQNRQIFSTWRHISRQDWSSGE